MKSGEGLELFSKLDNGNYLQKKWQDLAYTAATFNCPMGISYLRSQGYSLDTGLLMPSATYTKSFDALLELRYNKTQLSEPELVEIVLDAVNDGNVQLFEFLHKKFGFKDNLPLPNQEKLACIAAENGDVEFLKKLDALGFSMDKPNGQGHAPIQIAAAKGDIPIIEFLQKKFRGQDITQIAVEHGQEEVLPVILFGQLKSKIQMDAVTIYKLRDNVEKSTKWIGKKDKNIEIFIQKLTDARNLQELASAVNSYVVNPDKSTLAKEFGRNLLEALNKECSEHARKTQKPFVKNSDGFEQVLGYLQKILQTQVALTEELTSVTQSPQDVEQGRQVAQKFQQQLPEDPTQSPSLTKPAAPIAQVTSSAQLPQETEQAREVMQKYKQQPLEDPTQSPSRAGVPKSGSS
jgi:hypothetical protein